MTATQETYDADPLQLESAYTDIHKYPVLVLVYLGAVSRQVREMLAVSK